MRTLIIDNYDSFTYNLFQLVAKVSGHSPKVFFNDQISLKEIRNLQPHQIIISPGPGNPTQTEDFGISADILRELDIPVLGVCLGYQGIAHIAGGEIQRASEVMHGRTSEVFHSEEGLFRGIPQGFEVVRYHSLIVEEQLPSVLEKTAWTKDGILMGLRHREKPFWGVQFHPESILTEYGPTLIKNFLSLSEKYHCSGDYHHFAAWDTTIPPENAAEPVQSVDSSYKVISRRIPALYTSEEVFESLYAGQKDVFWLDSSQVGEGLSRFSYMGICGAGPEDMKVIYQQREGKITLEQGEEKTAVYGNIFDELNRILARYHADSPGLPFDFNGGLVGFLGYEVKADTSPVDSLPSETPDAVFLLTTRMLVFDHAKEEIWLIALVKEGEEDNANAWLDQTKGHLYQLPDPAFSLFTAEYEYGDIHLHQEYEKYLDSIAVCKEKIKAGETYEVCLTNRFTTRTNIHPYQYYRQLRASNPAPYAAYLQLGEMSIISSSPEMFLEIGKDRKVISKPIKGTAERRSNPVDDQVIKAKLAASEKDRSENLMIVDLLRNDLGKVCKTGTVSVPVLMDIETYATVHQMVSTITGELRDEVSVMDCLRATFPGGSITGAPKIRTMQIIDEVEKAPRGVYTGSIGFLGVNGTAALNIAIRTAVMVDREVTIGAGGAIVDLSDPDSEFEEIIVKARPLIHALTNRSPDDCWPESMSLPSKCLKAVVPVRND